MSRMAAGVTTVCFSIFLSEANFLMSLYDKFCLFGFVTIFEKALFRFLPKCASNVVVFVTLFGVSLIFWTMFAITVVISSNGHNGPIAIMPNLHFIVCTNFSKIPVARWSLSGASICSILVFLQKTLKSPDLNACAWSQCSERGIPWSSQ